MVMLWLPEDLLIPLFIKQIKGGKDLTVTNPIMTRFMMSLDEAVNLVLFAFKHGKQGDLFVQKSPASTVADVAEGVKKMFNSNANIRVIGTRHGEKLFETLLTKEEFAHAEEIEDYYRVPADNRDLNYGKYFSEGENKITESGEYHSHNTRRLTLEETISKMEGLSYVPEINALKNT